MPKPKQEQPQPQKLQEKTPEQIFWESAARKGFMSFHIVARSEDLNNPNTDYITLGFKDANGLPIPAITSTKEAWLATAKLILAKYGKEA